MKRNLTTISIVRFVHLHGSPFGLLSSLVGPHTQTVPPPSSWILRLVPVSTYKILTFITGKNPCIFTVRDPTGESKVLSPLHKHIIHECLLLRF